MTSHAAAQAEGTTRSEVAREALMRLAVRYCQSEERVMHVCGCPDLCEELDSRPPLDLMVEDTTRSEVCRGALVALVARYERKQR